ncbi:hypothetical protein FS837_012105 [Tulasnella sp. UAMH 9824]|nr:hypothetical protein FS837_012105 [Tulasnella sp. UAMH 9824]
MSDAVAPADHAMDTTEQGHAVEKPVSSSGKGKGKAVQDSNAMEEDEEEDDEEEDGVEAEDVEEDDDDDMEEDQPEFLDRRSRRTRAQVDYTSEEALKKAGLTKTELEEEDDDEEFHAKPTDDDD